MKTVWLFCGAVAVFCRAILAGDCDGLDQDEETVLLDNKCQCVRVTSKFVPSKDNPEDKVLHRNIHIMVPLTARENISDPTSPVRTKFVYKFSKLCEKCNSKDKPGPSQGVTAGESSLCSDPEEPCYTYDRKSCYTASCLFLNGEETETIKTALTPDSCYAN